MIDDDRRVETVERMVESRREDIVQLLTDLVRFPSETHPPGGDEGPVQEYMASRLSELGLDVDVFEPWSVAGIEEHPGWWPGLEYDNRPNVVGTYRSRGNGRSLILNGHIDVVPAGSRELWTRDPYGAIVEDGKLYGRGSADTKSGITAMVMALRCLLDAGLEPQGDVIVQSVVNEELGGYNGTLACVAKGYTADAAIVTEPTELNLAVASKGGQTYQATVPGRAAHHAWWWEGASALDHAMVVKEALRRWEALRADEMRNAPLFSDRTAYPTGPALADTVWYLRAGDPEIMANPSSAEMAFWVDVLPGEDREATLRRFEQFVREETAHNAFLRDNPPILERALMRPFTGVEVDPRHPVVAAVSDSYRTVTGGEPRAVGMAGASDSMIFSLYSDTPALVFGPGSLHTAHAPNEFVDIHEVIDACKIFALTILQFCDEREVD
jgi:acetylornithine deacetylase